MKLSSTVLLLTGLLAGLGSAAPADPSLAEAGWPQFRGPSGDGTTAATGLPLVWSETNGVAWKVPVPGRGRSSPVALGDRLWLTSALGQDVRRTRIGPDDMQAAEHVTLEAICLDRADGKILWETALFEVDKPAPVHWLNSWATPTPVVEPGRLYCDFGTFGTACVNARTGEVLWRQHLPLNHQVGPGSSPVLWQDSLLLVRDGLDAQYVAALNKQNGQQVWKTDRPPIHTPSADLRKAFSTPLLVQTAGHTQMIAPGAHWIVSYDPGTGNELWRARHGEGFSFGSCPVFGHGMVFFSTGCFTPQMWAIRADGEGDVTSTKVAWKYAGQVPVMSSPVLGGDELYWVSDDGIAFCAEAGSGQVLWQARLGGQHLASPLYAEGRVYFFGLDGKTTVVKAGRQFERLAENRVEGPLAATPALLDGSILLRTDSHLYRIGKPYSAAEPLPLPSPQQLVWQRHEFIAFAHFGMNTFTEREWGEGQEDPKLFNPTDFDARQWATVLKDAGVKLLILTAKHHDGFCLWPSQFTEHSVKNSPWRGGKGDVVQEVVEALRQQQIRVGLYLSPWDRNQPTYGDSPKYND